MKQQLAQWMICPVTGEKLTLRIDQQLDGEILEGELISTGGRRYPITRGVPRMLSADLVDAGQTQTQDAFSAKWQFATDFGHEEKSRSFYLNWYLERYKFGTIEALKNFLSGKD